MLCQVGNYKIEKSLKEVGECAPSRGMILNHLPPLRFRNNIVFLNRYLGISITRAMVLEHLVKPAKHFLLGRLRELYSRVEDMRPGSVGRLFPFLLMLEGRLFHCGLYYRDRMQAYVKLRKKEMPRSLLDQWRGRLLEARSTGLLRFLPFLDRLERRIFENRNRAGLSLKGYRELRRRETGAGPKRSPGNAQTRKRVSGATRPAPLLDRIEMTFYRYERRILGTLGEKLGVYDP